MVRIGEAEDTIGIGAIVNVMPAVAEGKIRAEGAVHVEETAGTSFLGDRHLVRPAPIDGGRREFAFPVAHWNHSKRHGWSPANTAALLLLIVENTPPERNMFSFCSGIGKESSPRSQALPRPAKVRHAPALCMPRTTLDETRARGGNHDLITTRATAFTGRVTVVGPDVYGLDRDGDGTGCE